MKKNRFLISLMVFAVLFSGCGDKAGNADSLTADASSEGENISSVEGSVVEQEQGDSYDRKNGYSEQLTETDKETDKTVIDDPLPSFWNCNLGDSPETVMRLLDDRGFSSQYTCDPSTIDPNKITIMDVPLEGILPDGFTGSIFFNFKYSLLTDIYVMDIKYDINKYSIDEAWEKIKDALIDNYGNDYTGGITRASDHKTLLTKEINFDNRAVFAELEYAEDWDGTIEQKDPPVFNMQDAWSVNQIGRLISDFVDQFADREFLYSGIDYDTYISNNYNSSNDPSDKIKMWLKENAEKDVLDDYSFSYWKEEIYLSRCIENDKYAYDWVILYPVYHGIKYTMFYNMATGELVADPKNTPVEDEYETSDGGLEHSGDKNNEYYEQYKDWIYSRIENTNSDNVKTISEAEFQKRIVDSMESSYNVNFPDVSIHRLTDDGWYVVIAHSDKPFTDFTGAETNEAVYVSNIILGETVDNTGDAFYLDVS